MNWASAVAADCIAVTASEANLYCCFCSEASLLLLLTNSGLNKYGGLPVFVVVGEGEG
jgi:hypothetical protein